MRESNFAFPAQNRACVCITSQLYDRRALDTNSPLPLFNSLTHLTYLTSTSPRIREIMTMDGGLERLVRILHDFCICPPPPENPTLLYGLSAPSSQPTKLVPTLNPKSFDKHAAYRFSLAFQCVVNIGVRGSEPIRSRVVQAGTLDVVGCILEAWLANKGFAVGPSVSASGMPRETREQRLARRAAQSEARQREHAAQQAAQLARALQERIRADRVAAINQEDERMESEVTGLAPPNGARDGDTSAETSSNATPLGSNTPTGTVVVPARDRSGTVIARPVWDQVQAPAGPSHHRRVHHHHRNIPSRLNVPPPNSDGGPSTSTSTDTSRPETETEDDGDVDMEDSTRESDAPSVSGASTPERRNPSPEATGTIRAAPTHSRRAVGIVSDTGGDTGPVGALDMISDARVIINDQAVGVQGVGGVEDGIVSLETNDDFAMGAPPGAPGAIDGPPAITDPHAPAGERTPRAGPVGLPTVMPAIPPVPAPPFRVIDQNGQVIVPTPFNHGPPRPGARGLTAAVTGGVNGTNGRHHHHHHNHDAESGPYRDEDVLLSLQLLAYLSKYPHVRQAFYKSRTTFHPASANQQPSEVKYAGPSRVASTSTASTSTATPPNATTTQPATKETNNPFLKAFATATGRGKEKEKATSIPSASNTTATGNTPTRMTNVFSLVERFTFRPSSSELDSPNPPPTLPPDIQYWAGVIMRNACRKDDSRGGIRQCANMMCGKWETFPREFAKCRRCRKAKYCGKECQSTAWSEGHRFWCSAKDPDEDGDHHNGDGTRARANTLNASNSTANASTNTVTPATAANGNGRRAERRAERERRDGEERDRRVAIPLNPPNGWPQGNNTLQRDMGQQLVQFAQPPERTVVDVRPNPPPTGSTATQATVVAGPPPPQGISWQWSASILNMRRPRYEPMPVVPPGLPAPIPPRHAIMRLQGPEDLGQDRTQQRAERVPAFGGRFQTQREDETEEDNNMVLG